MTRLCARSLLTLPLLLIGATSFGGCDPGTLPWASLDGPGDGDGDAAGDGDGDVAGPRPVDILLVVDNSGSMCEEQQNLVDNFFDDGCPIADLGAVPEAWRDPDEATLNELSAQCGMVQVLAALGVDARFGVITTDVGPCDNRYGIADDPAFAGHPNICGDTQPLDWGRRPQRGCLQAPAGAPRFVDMADDDVGGRFAGLIGAVGTYGSGFERGLDAARIFLEADAPAAGCEGDAAAFLRPGADLLVVFLSDEDDCSHPTSADFPDENAGEGCTGTEDYPEVREPPVSASYCYQRSGALTPVSEFVTFFDQLAAAEGKTVRVASVGGGVYVDNAVDPTPAGCRIDENGKPDGVCTASQGNSNFNFPGAPCDPDVLAGNGQPECCAADPGTRYFQLASAFGERGRVDSICYASFRDTLLEVARLAAGQP